MIKLTKFAVLIIIVTFVFNLGSLGVVFSTELSSAPLFNVDVAPYNAGSVAEYHIYGSFSEYNKVNTLKIYFRFDTSFSGPSAPYGSVLVNNMPALGVQFRKVEADGSVEATVYLAQYLNSGDKIDILFKKEAGIINPITPATCYKVRVVLVNYLGVELGAILSNSYRITVSAVQAVSVKVEPPVKGMKAQYTVSFVTGSRGALNSTSGEIRVKFPMGTTIPSTLSKSHVLINNAAAKSIYRDNNDPSVLRIYAPFDISPNHPVTIVFDKDFGITNPMMAGLKTISVSTFAEPDWVESTPYEIFEPQVKNLNIDLSNTTIGLMQAINVSFVTSPVGYLDNNSKIYVQFPNDFYVPSSSNLEGVLVNGEPAQALSSSNIVSINVSSQILQLSTVEITIPDGVGIRNPLKTGDYVINVWTDSDAFKTPFTVNITQSFLTNVKLEAQYSGASSVNSFNVSFTTGPVYTLSKDSDMILVKFDEGFTLPNTIEQNLITVNGTVANNITKDGNTLYITTPIDISPGSTVEVEILEGFGIKNPESPGAYGVTVSTTKEPAGIESNKIAITLLPRVNFDVSPSVPNGLNGFYKTNPEIKLYSTNNDKVFYKIDDGEFTEYTNPFKIPEGTHAVYAYAVDSGNNKGDIIKKEFLVDSTPPIIKFDNASSNPVFKGSPGKLYGSVSEPCTLKINDTVLELKDDLTFSIELPNVYEGMTIVVYLVDLAGNATQLPLLTAHIDNTAPVIKFIGDGISYQNGMYSVEVTDSYYTIRVQLNEKGKLFINSTEIISKDNNNFESMVNLVDGENRFDVKAIDVAGNEAVQTLIVRKVNEKKIVLTVGSTLAIVGNEQITLEAAPVIEQGVTLVPLRFIAEAFDSEVNWNGALQIITIVNKTHNIQLQVNSKLVFIDNQKGKDLDVAPKIINGRTFVPIRFISEAFGATVDWDNNTKTVTITFKP
ncbi:MAG: hypothetical protein KBG04_04940 [Bacteroidales bacterium]|nr:hypothetical protein [Bacteroidales bacterium]